VDDASGHYDGSFYWGNNYWTGSMKLCRSIFKTDLDDEFYYRKQTSSNVGLSFMNGNGAASVQFDHENPPFLPRFAVLKVVFEEKNTTPVVSFNLHLLNSKIEELLKVQNI
jgi:hypothetical protein